MAGEVSRIFLGVQIQCAQCHDHKTDSWKREQFHEFAAFFSGDAGQAGRAGNAGAASGLRASWPRAGRGTRCPTRTNPHKQIPIAPKFFLASLDSRRRQLPEGLDAGERRRAGGVVRHRPGQPLVRPGVRQPDLVRADGRGVLRPGRRPGPGADAQGPRGARDALPTQWQKGGYDIRWLFRTILNTTGLPAAGPLDGQRRPARRRSPRTARAGSAPTRSSTPWSRRWDCPRT